MEANSPSARLDRTPRGPARARAGLLGAAIGLAIGVIGARQPAPPEAAPDREPPSIGRAQLEALLATALAPVESELQRIADRTLPLLATRAADEVAAADPVSDSAADATARFEALLARCEERLAQLASASWNAPLDGTLEQRLERVRRGKDLAAVERAWEELDVSGRKAVVADYALLGPQSIAERFGAPDTVGGSGGKTWWHWRIDDERSLGVAFANGLVCDVEMP